MYIWSVITRISVGPRVPWFWLFFCAVLHLIFTFASATEAFLKFLRAFLRLESMMGQLSFFRGDSSKDFVGRVSVHKKQLSPSRFLEATWNGEDGYEELWCSFDRCLRDYVSWLISSTGKDIPIIFCVSCTTNDFLKDINHVWRRLKVAFSINLKLTHIFLK